MPSLAHRIHAEEWMDDFDITDRRLTRALDDLRGVNAWLGGYAATRRVLAPWMRSGQTLRVLDLGTGVADIPERLVRDGAKRGADVEVTGIDANPATVRYAQEKLARRLPPSLRRRVHVDVGDALALPYDDDAFDVVTAALFMHHLDDDDAVRLLREMGRVARRGVLVNDLHRHWLAYYGIRALAALLPVSPMFRHDGPLSVRRGFRGAELVALAERAGLAGVQVRWHWAFRWTLSTLPPRR